MLIGHITAALEQFAPPQLQEEYDNCGLIIGSPAGECTGVLISVDVTPAVVKEAIDSGCNLIVAHHPLLFKGIKRLNGLTPVEQSIKLLLRNDIAVYACHTCLDNAEHGVSHMMAEKLGLQAVKVLDPKQGSLTALSVYTPAESANELLLSLIDAGAGHIGNYDSCSFAVKGTATFRPLEGADPYSGEIGYQHTGEEIRLDMVLPSYLRNSVEKALLQVHPYEEPAYQFTPMLNGSRHTGLGTVGNLPKAMSPVELVEKVKNTFGSPVARCTTYPADSIIRRVALCGGSGASLIPKAIAAGAQAKVTSDTRYHDFVDYADTILIIDIGHHESENCTKDIFYHIITKKFPNFAVRYANTDTNPINYL
ncbi:MAG: Nif3-like dinuclear metal center hexameric protein [Paramuribaculum sp.]|nr:Nif3-like dinuclear metal center hexameric protein [Paramuribaculum sp.]